MAKNTARKRQKVDYQRPLRVAKFIDFPFVLSDSPVEVEEGYIVSDRETCDVFASFIFKNVYTVPLNELKIRLSLYHNQNIPYQHIEFAYSSDELRFGIISKNGVELKLREANKRTSVETGESFGSCVFIPIPERYFTRMDVTLVSACFSDGREVPINALVTGSSKKYSELDDISKLVYSRVNIYQMAEDKYPTRVIPQFGEKSWLCCCGMKNSASEELCTQCGREKEWQKNSVTADALEEIKTQMVSDPKEVTLHDKTRYAQNKYLETDEESQKKIDRYELAMKNIAENDRKKHIRQLMLIPKILLAVLVVYLISFVLRVIMEFQTPIADTAMISLFKLIS